MLFYIVFFLINICLAYFADKYKKCSSLFLFAIVLLNTVVLGLRDFGVGTDTNVYIEQYYRYALSIKNIRDFLSYEHVDKGFLLISCVCVNVYPQNSQCILVGTELFIITFFVLGIYRYHKILGVKMWTMMTLFCFLYSMHTMNLMRQSCAILLLFYAYTFFLEKRTLIYAILQVVAFFFHSSSLFFVMVPIFHMISKVQNDKTRYIFLILLVIGISIALMSYTLFIGYLGELGAISEVYATRYGSGSTYSGSSYSRLSILIETTISITVIYLIYKAHKRGILNKNSYFFILMLYVSFAVLNQYLPIIMAYVGRVSYYLWLVFMVYYAELLTEKRLPKHLRLFLFLFILWDWYNVFIVLKGGEVVPFNSKILGI